MNIAIAPPVHDWRDDYERDDGAKMVPIGGSPHCSVNVEWYSAKPAAGNHRIAIGAWPLADCKLSVSELWRPASRLTTNIRFVCQECIHWPAKVWTTVGPTVWLNGALLLTVAQNGYGIINSRRGSRPRYAKQKMEGVPLATPQQAPLSHTLWNDVSPVKTESDPRAMNHRDTAAFNRKDVTLKEAEKAAAKWGSIVWSMPSTGGEVKVTNTNPRLVQRPDAWLRYRREQRRRVFFWTCLAPSPALLWVQANGPVPSFVGGWVRDRWGSIGSEDKQEDFLHLCPARPPRKKGKPRSWWKARALLDWHAVFFARWNAGGDHLHTERVAVRQPGGGEYSPIWYRRRKWCEGDPKGPEGQITYLGSPGCNECSPGKRINKWPFAHMRFRSVGQALYEVGIVHLNYWVTSGIEGPVSSLYNGRAEHRRKVYLGALVALKKREALTRKPYCQGRRNDYLVYRDDR